METELIGNLFTFYCRIDTLSIILLALRSDRLKEWFNFCRIFRYKPPVIFFLLTMLFFVLPFTIYESLIVLKDDYKRIH